MSLRIIRILNVLSFQDSIKKESGRDFMLDPKYGYIHSCPTNLGTGRDEVVSDTDIKAGYPVLKFFIRISSRIYGSSRVLDIRI